MITKEPRPIGILGAGKSILIAAFAAAAIVGSPGRAVAQTCPDAPLLNGSFEQPAITGQSQIISSGLNDWTIGSGQSITLIRNFWQSADGQQSIDLNGNGAGSISQTFCTLPNRKYTVSFVYAGHPSLGSNPATMTMQWGSSVPLPFTFTGSSTKQNMGWVPYTNTFTSTSATTTLTFTSTTDKNSNYGVALDKVSVTLVPLQNQATLSVTGPTSVTYGTTGTATVSGGSGTGAVTFSAGSSIGCSVAGNTVSVTNASGTCTLTATKAADSTYGSATSAPFTVTLAKASQATLSVTAPGSVTFGTTGIAAAIGGSGTGAVTFSATGSTGCSIAGTTVSVSDASGSCALTATKAADDNYNSTTSGSFTVALAKATQATLTVTGPSSVALGTTGTATATGGSGGGAVTFATSSTDCSLTGTSVSVINVGGTCSITATKAADNNYSVATSAPFAVTLLPPPYATPVLIHAVATTTTDTFVIGRVDGASSLGLTLQVDTAATCTNGALVGGSTIASGILITTDAAGYFGAAVPSVPEGNFVVVRVTAPAATATSVCLASTGGNDTWPKALVLAGSAATTQDYIDAPGKARWYKFHVLPGQRIKVTLSGLPADYDLAVFKDIGSTFLDLLDLNTTKDLTRLSAEYAPSTFSPSTFSPSTFSPSTFSPDAYTPSTFSPSTFSADVYSPSTFSPSTFSPSTFSPSTFSPSTFSPSTFSPSTFSPSTFSPSTFSPSTFSSDEISMAFSSAQTRSLIGVSATPGTGDELVVVNSWNNTGDFYIRVAGRAGAYTTGGRFTVGVEMDVTNCTSLTNLTPSSRSAAAAVTGMTTVILTDSSKIDQTVATGITLRSKLDALAAAVGGVVVDVNGDTAVEALKTQATNNPFCPFAKNLLAEEIKGIVDSYRQNNSGLKYVVVAGNDGVIPFFRYPDQTLLGQESGYVPPVKGDSFSEASLRGDYILSQDAYGAGTRISLRTSSFPVPGLAVGRLVETAAEIAGMIDTFLANPVVTPGSSLVTGYDFLADAANAVNAELTAGMLSSAVKDTLITASGISPQDSRSWTAADLGLKLFGGRHDLIYLAGHFSANSALAADFATDLLTTDVAISTTNFTNSIVFSAGCHSGYNLVDGDAITGVTLPLDWAQVFAQKKATLIAGTGYQYGDTDFIEYSERIYLNFARQLRTGTGNVAIGEALVKAKLDYLAATPDVRGLHEKALLEATLFGLPMLGVNMPGTRLTASNTGAAITTVDATWPPGTSADAVSLGLRIADYTLTPSLTSRSKPLTSVDPAQANVSASWLEGPQGVVSNPVEPALPLVAINVSPKDLVNPAIISPTLVLRGVGFRGGAYADDTVTPLTGAATTDLRGVHVPFVSSVFYPMRPWTINHFLGFGGTNATSLLVTPAQHRAFNIAQGTSTRRTFSNLTLRLFYSGNLAPAALSDAPSIVKVIALPYAGGVEFTAQVVGDPAAAINQVWITYTSDGSGSWIPLDLEQCVAPLPAVCTAADSSIWKGRLASTPSNFVYVIQAANGYGLVTFDDNFGAYYRMGGTALAPTSVALLSTPPSGAKFGDSVSVTAKLTATSGGAALAGQNVIVTIGGAARAGLTDGTGQVAVNVPLVSVPGTYKTVVSFAGDASYLPSSASSTSFAVAQAPSTLSQLNVTTGVTTLTASVGGKTQPLLLEDVKYVVTPTSPLKEFHAATDYLGRATIPTTNFGLAAGTYTLTASFAGNATYTPATTSQTLNVTQDAPQFDHPLPTTLNLGGSTTFTVSTLSGQPVTVTLTPASTPYCTLTGTGPTYTLTAVLTGNCTLVFTSGGTTTFSTINITQVVTVAKAAQTITFALGDQTFGTPPLTLSATATSGLTVTFAATGQCSVSGTTLTLASTGSCAITASQAGNADWAAAPDLTQTILIDLVNAWKRTEDLTQPARPQTFMTQARSYHTATRLNDGTVLIAGGLDTSGAPLATSEIFNPVTGKFATKGNMPSKSANHSATLLPSGKVIVFGGGNSSAQMYDPVAGTWASAGSTSSNRSYHTATLLTTGKVLIVGGADNAGKTLDTTIVYDPSGAGTYTAGPTLPGSPRERHTATALPDGKVLIVGGRYKQGNTYKTLNTYLICNVTACTSFTDNVASRHSHAAVSRVTSTGETKVLVTGGTDGGADVGVAELYTYVGTSGTWSSNGLGTLTPARRELTLSNLPNGRALAVGGRGKATPTSTDAPLASVDIFVPPFAAAAPMTSAPLSAGAARAGHAATPLRDSGGNIIGILVTGGVSTATGSSINSAQIYGTQ